MKFYFAPDINDENCYTKKDIIEMMKEEGLTVTEIFPAKMVTGESYFWCSLFQDVGEVGESCGRECTGYSPRNGKNGRCKHSKNCYEPADEPIILKSGKE